VFNTGRGSSLTVSSESVSRASLFLQGGLARQAPQQQHQQYQQHQQQQAPQTHGSVVTKRSVD
jgi:hypothetical protein